MKYSLWSQATSTTVLIEKPETLRVWSVDAMRLGAWLRSGEGIGWLAAGTNQTLSIEWPSIFFRQHVLCVIVSIFLSFWFCFYFYFYFHALSLEL